MERGGNSRTSMVDNTGKKEEGVTGRLKNLLLLDLTRINKYYLQRVQHSTRCVEVLLTLHVLSMRAFQSGSETRGCTVMVSYSEQILVGKGDAATTPGGPMHLGWARVDPARMRRRTESGNFIFLAVQIWLGSFGCSRVVKGVLSTFWHV